MSVRQLQAARAEAILARRRLESTVGALQLRLHPRALASDAWDGVKEKSSEVADNAVEAVKAKPAAASLGVAALALFLGRKPIGRAVSRLMRGEEPDDGRIVTRIDRAEDDQIYAVAAPFADADLSKGVK